jgi:hypothetical protein
MLPFIIFGWRVDQLEKGKSVKKFHTLECPVAGFRKI